MTFTTMELAAVIDGVSSELVVIDLLPHFCLNEEL